jgi:DNA-directed RNA polymerase delta subunit
MIPQKNSKFKNQDSDILNCLINTQSQEKIQNFEPSQHVSELISHLPERMNNILTYRYGLNGNEILTLEEIGRKYAITRERVRQIENESLFKLRKRKLSNLLEIEKLLLNVFKEHGEVLTEENVFNKSLSPNNNSPSNQKALLFILKLLDEFIKINQNREIYTIWSSNQDSVEIAQKLVNLLIGHFEQRSSVTPHEKIISTLWSQEYVKEHPGLFSDNILISYISISKKIKQNPYGEWGLSSWPTIYPKGVRDKAYLVTKKYTQPLHFSEIAEEINKTKFDHKKAFPQTVHNELIKDPRFVLIGRGIYALREWGYQEGTVLDVLVEILSQQKEPMHKKDIINKVLEKRQVKKNTVILNLQNSRFFDKIDSNHYQIKKQK